MFVCLLPRRRLADSENAREGVGGGRVEARETLYEVSEKLRLNDKENGFGFIVCVAGAKISRQRRKSKTSIIPAPTRVPCTPSAMHKSCGDNFSLRASINKWTNTLNIKYWQFGRWKRGEEISSLCTFELYFSWRLSVCRSRWLLMFPGRLRCALFVRLLSSSCCFAIINQCHDMPCETIEMSVESVASFAFPSSNELVCSQIQQTGGWRWMVWGISSLLFLVEGDLFSFGGGRRWKCMERAIREDSNWMFKYLMN